MKTISDVGHQIYEGEQQLLAKLRAARRARREAVDEHALELRHGAEELLVLGGRAEAHWWTETAQS